MNQAQNLAKRLLPIEEGAEYLGMTAWALRHRISQGLIPYVRIGRRILLDIQDLDALIDRLKVSYE